MVYQKSSFLTTAHSLLPMNTNNLQRHGILTTTPQAPIFRRVMDLLKERFKPWNALSKAQESGQDVHLALLTLNTTPSRDGKSPAFKLFNRNPRTPLPSIIPNKLYLIPTNHKIKQHHDRHANNLQELAPGAAVRMRIDSDTSWKETGKIIERCQQPRSYLVLNSKGNIVRRNRRHLLPTTETFKVQANYDQLPTIPNETTLAQNPKPSSTQPSCAKEKQKQSDTTITRSGRQSRPPVRYPNTDENWKEKQFILFWTWTCRRTLSYLDLEKEDVMIVSLLTFSYHILNLLILIIIYHLSSLCHPQ